MPWRCGHASAVGQGHVDYVMAGRRVRRANGDDRARDSVAVAIHRPDRVAEPERLDGNRTVRRIDPGAAGKADGARWLRRRGLLLDRHHAGRGDDPGGPDTELVVG